MTIFDDIFNILLPHYPKHSVLEFANRFKSQHILGFVLALCTIGFNPYVGQAGIGAIDQVQVSNHSPVPQYAVSAQPQNACGTGCSFTGTACASSARAPSV